MRDNRDVKVYKGGVRNRINHVTMRTGESVVAYQDLTANQSTNPHILINRTARPAEQPTERSLQDGVKYNDV